MQDLHCKSNHFSINYFGWPWKGPSKVQSKSDLLGGGVFGNSLSTFGDGVLGKFTWKEKSDSSLDLTWWDGWSLVVFGQSRGFTCDTIEDITNKGVHDIHGLRGNTSVWVYLFQDFVDINLERLFCFLDLLAWFASACCCFIFWLEWQLGLPQWGSLWLKIIWFLKVFGIKVFWDNGVQNLSSIS